MNTWGKSWIKRKKISKFELREVKTNIKINFSLMFLGNKKKKKKHNKSDDWCRLKMKIPGMMILDQPLTGVHADNPPTLSWENIVALWKLCKPTDGSYSGVDIKACSHPNWITFFLNGPPHSSCLLQAQAAALLLTYNFLGHAWI